MYVRSELGVWRAVEWMPNHRSVKIPTATAPIKNQIQEVIL